MKKLNLLLLEHDEFDIFLIKKILEKAEVQCDITVVASEAEFSAALQENTYNAILSDNSLPQFNATNALKIVKNKGIRIPFILVTGTVSEEFAVEIMKEGAWDYILKDRLQRLPNAILNAINKHKLETEYQKKLDDIIKSEALMKEAERLARFGTWEVDLVTETQRWSDENYCILGYKPGEVTPSFDNFLNRVHPDDLHYVQKTIDDLFENLSYQKYFCRIITKNEQQVIHIECEIFITQDEHGEIVRFNGFTRDISERKNEELQRIESEKKYQYLFENNPIPAWVLDSGTFRFLDVNKAAIAHYGYSYEEFLSMTALDIRPEEEKGRFLSLDRTEKEFTDKGVWKHKKKDGTIIQVEIYVVEILFNKNNCRLVIANDITGKMEAEQALVRSEANLHLILDLIPLSIFSKDYYGNFLFVNKNFAELHGHPAGEMIGKPVRETIPVIDEADPLLQHDREVMLSGETKIVPELKFTRHTGETRIFHVTKLPYTPAGKSERAVLGIADDITENILAESERMKMTGDIIQRNKDLEQFSYIVSHNLRAPVANLLGISDLMEKGNLTISEKEFLLEGITDSVKKLDNVIIDLNHITQIKNSVNESKDQVDFLNIVNNITAGIKNYAENNEISIVTNFSEIGTFYTIKNYMHSIFYNLITNSIKYKKPGQPLLCEITSKKQGNTLQLLFKDNGMGIDIEKTGDQLFELYKRFHIGAAEGKGMGLFMVKTHVESMGGTISVTSEVNKGTEFTIEFPLTD